MVRRGLGRDRHAVGLGRTDELDAAGRRQVQEVDARAGEPGQLDVAVDHQLLGDRRPAGQAELAAAAALVHHRPLGERGPPRSAGRATMSSPSEYSIARRISSGSCTPLPSSVKSRTPAAASSANGASASPRAADA